MKPDGLELFIDLSKSLNRAKLVRRMVQVRGKNGKIFTRMQWVDPNTGQPVSPKSGKKKPEGPHKRVALHGESSVHHTQKTFIDQHVKNMKPKDKDEFAAKHKLNWDRHENPQRDRILMADAIRNHLYDNPHLAGAEHLPKEDTREGTNLTPSGKDKITDFTDKWKKDPEGLYDLMRKLGVIGKDDVDPRTVKELGPKSEGGNGTAPIKHMSNMTKLKRMLMDNAHLMDDPDNQTKTQAATKPPKPSSTVPSEAEKCGNTVQGVLKTLPRERLYELMKQHGIADVDPALVPEWAPKKDGGNGTAPIKHMSNMGKLKKLLEQNPSILNADTDGEISEQEKKRIKGMNEEQKLSDDVKEFMNSMSKEWKEKMIDKYGISADTDSDHPQIIWMHQMTNLRKHFEQNPDLLEKHAADREQERLSNLKIGNKQLGKILRGMFGIKGVGDVTQVEPYKEWAFGDSSFARLEEREDGTPVLSVVDTGKDGDGWDEHEVPLSDVSNFLDDLKSGKGTAASAVAKATPLHEQHISKICKALNSDFDANFDSGVAKRISTYLSQSWEKSGYDNIHGLVSWAKNMEGLDEASTLKAMRKLGVPALAGYPDLNSKQWKKLALSHLVQSTKEKHADDYLIKYKNGHTDTYVLHESARKWTPQERAQARRDMIGSRLTVAESLHKDDHDSRMQKLVSHLHLSTEYTPFDLMTDVLAAGATIDIPHTGDRAEDTINMFEQDGNRIKLDTRFYNDDSIHSNNPQDHKPAPINIGSVGKILSSHIGDTMAHEFAHAIDYFLSDGKGFTQWEGSRAEKYAGKHSNCIHQSYDAKVNKSNPGKLLGVAKNGSRTYMYHLDQWNTHYEGRIYDPRYTNRSTAKDYVGKTEDGKAYDAGYESNKAFKGVEHWSESVSMFANAVHSYAKWRGEDPEGRGSVSMDSWARQMHDEFSSKGFVPDNPEVQGSTGFKVGLDAYPMQGHGWAYHRLSAHSPVMHKALKHMFDRADFVDGPRGDGRINMVQRGDNVRKSEGLFIELEGLQ